MGTVGDLCQQDLCQCQPAPLWFQFKTALLLNFGQCQSLITLYIFSVLEAARPVTALWTEARIGE